MNSFDLFRANWAWCEERTLGALQTGATTNFSITSICGKRKNKGLKTNGFRLKKTKKTKKRTFQYSVNLTDYIFSDLFLTSENLNVEIAMALDFAAGCLGGNILLLFLITYADNR